MAYNWDQYAAEWEQATSITAFAHNAFQQLKEMIDLSGKHVLDFGCGTGLLTQYMAAHAKDVVALDGSESMIEELDKKALSNVEPVVDELSRGLVAQHPAFRKQFDLIVASSVCAYLPNRPESMSIIHSLLEEGGVFIHWDWLAEDAIAEGEMPHSQARQMMEQAGFHDVAVQHAFSIPDGEQLRPVIMGIGYK
ncbi:class I SAM-dependent DNA methyltransferase [Vibrio zhugei]|uniref:Class I SAM-dependent DNA methyltransferase n=1 Tax=Vibrio zhugei TaxID=2479546 RepID=A0ABV7CB16_9VIBR|nr:class I SAM-dependent methyltransferase [Vibrio zhugei]